MVCPVLTVVLAVAASVLAFLLLRPEDAQGDEGTGSTESLESPAGATAAEGARALTTSAEAAAATACEVLAEVDADVTDMASDEGHVVSSQLAAAGVLAMVAEDHDESYADFRADLEMPRQVMMQMFSMDNDEYRTALEDAQRSCADVVDEG